MSKDFGLIHELRLSGVDWNTIKDIVDWFTDNDRKVYAGWLLGKEVSQDDDIIKNAKTLQKIRVAQKRLGYERSINNEQIRDITLHQTFTDQVVKAIQETSVNLDFRRELKPTVQEMAHIFVTADFHYDGDKSMLDVLKRVYDEITYLVAKENMTHIYLVELGDVVEGATLRTSQLMAIKSGIVNQTIEVAKAYTQLLSALSKVVDVTFISVDSSNHTQVRNLGTKQNQLVEEDLMLVFNGFIREALPDLRMVNGVDVYMNILGFDFFFAHGHLVKSKDKYIESLQADRNIMIDYAIFGHFHHMRDIDLHSAGWYDKKVFYAPSLCPKKTTFETDRNLSSMNGIAYHGFTAEDGHIVSRKILLK